jgi:CubicO group peptidase (beta-lactamase class C family)
MRILRYCLAVSLLVLLSSRFQAFAASARPVVDAIDGLIDEYVAGEYFAGSVLVAKDGEVLLARGYGMADPERDIPNTPDTRFMIGSITKQFTAMLAM